MADQEDRAKRLAELQKQRNELDKLIRELAAENATAGTAIPKTNIPYAERFVDTYAVRKASRLGSAPPTRLLEMKIFLNKKCNQISTDYAHTMSLIREIQPLRNDVIFQELFVHKLIEQGRGQVAAHLDSYKPLSYILVQLDNPEMVSSYVHLMITRQGNEQELKGLYAIYFGYLNLREDLPACWMWLASVLNSEQNTFSGYVLEVFLNICGEMLCERCSKFIKIVRYIERYFLAEIPVEAVRVRIRLILESLKLKVK